MIPLHQFKRVSRLIFSANLNMWLLTVMYIQISLRGLLSHIQQLKFGYWGPPSLKTQSMASYGLPSPRPADALNDSHQPAEVSGVGRSWVQSMFSRDRASRSDSFSRVRKWASDSGALGL